MLPSAALQYAAMFLNVLMVGAALFWALRAELFSGEDALRRAPLDQDLTSEENENG